MNVSSGVPPELFLGVPPETSVEVSLEVSSETSLVGLPKVILRVSLEVSVVYLEFPVGVPPEASPVLELLWKFI